MTAPNNDPMTRIADALDVLALDKLGDYSRDVEHIKASNRPTWRAINALRDRIEARHSAPTVTVPVLPTTDAGNATVDEMLTRKPAKHMCSFGCGRPATETANGEPVCGDGDSCIEMDRKSAPQTVDVKGSELRVGDTVVAIRPGGGKWNAGMPGTVSRITGDRVIYTDELTSYAEHEYRVRLPRPAVEPSARAKCPTCRCMIVPGAECACCASTSGDDPPLPDLDRDDAEPSAGGDDVRPEYSASSPKRIVMAGSPEPNASGDGIARFRNARLEIGSYAWALGDLQSRPPTSWVPAVATAINAAHEHATRELRERCERAECERDEARAEFNAVANERDRAKIERDAAVKRAELAERVVEAAHRWAQYGSIHRDGASIHAALRDYDAARKDGGK